MEVRRRMFGRCGGLEELELHPRGLAEWGLAPLENTQASANSPQNPKFQGSRNATAKSIWRCHATDNVSAVPEEILVISSF